MSNKTIQTKESAGFSTSQLISLARTAGVNFGRGNPTERLRYLARVGLIQKPRRLVDPAFTPKQNEPPRFVGVYPADTLEKLIKIDSLLRAGKTIAEVKNIVEGEGVQPRSAPAGSIQPKKGYIVLESEGKGESAPPPGPSFAGGIFSKAVFTVFAILILVFSVVAFSLAVGGGRSAKFLQVAPYNIYTKNILPVSGEATSERVLAAQTSSPSIYSKIYGFSSDLFATVLRPFVNLAEVMLYGAHYEVNYAFGPNTNQALTVNPTTSTTNNNFLPVDNQGGINVTGTAVFNTLLKAAAISAGTIDTNSLSANSVSTGSLNVSGNTTLGTDRTDTVTVNGSIASDLVPSTTATYNLGSGAERWKSGYFSDNIYIDSENRIGSDGMTTSGSLYINAQNGGSIYLSSDSGVLYLGKGTNKLMNSDLGVDFIIDASGGGRLCFRSCANYFDVNNNETVAGNLTVGGTISSSSSSGSSFSGPLTITSTTQPQLSVRYDASNRIDTSVSSTGAVTLDAVGAGSAFTIADALTTSSDLTVNGNTILGASSSNTIAFNGRSTTSFVPNLTASVDLGCGTCGAGSTPMKWNNLWVQTINATGTNTSGQASFTYDPATTAFSEASVLINPTTSDPNETLLGIGKAGVEKAGIDQEGDLVVGYSSASAPLVSNPFNVYNHGTTNVSFIDASGNGYFAGNVGVGVTAPTAALEIATSGAASTSGGLLSGTWYTGGTTTTTKPQFLIQPTGTTSTNWSTSGTGFGINAASGFAGNLLDLQIAAVSKVSLPANAGFNITNATTNGTPGTATTITTGDPSTKGLIIKGTLGTATLLNNIAAYWKFDEGSGTNVADSVDSNTGTTHGSSAWTGSGKINSAGAFDVANSNYVSAGNNASINLTSAISISTWIYPTAAGDASNLSAIIQKGSAASSTSDPYAIVWSSSDKILVTLESSTGFIVQNLASTSTVPLNQWTHVVVTYDSTTGVINIYLNGNATPDKTTTVATGQNMNIVSSVLYIGALQFGTNPYKYFTGRIDEMGIWSRALTSSEVSQLYNAGAGLQYNFGVPPQTANLTEWQDSTGAVLSSIGANGAGTIAVSTTTPLVIGGTTTTSTLQLRSTSGVGTTGADIIFQTGNNGGTEAMRILNSGNVGIGTTNPGGTLSIVSSGTTGTTTSSAFNLTANSVNSGTVGYINATGLTTGKILDIAATVSDSSGASTNTGINVDITHSPTVLADTYNGYFQTITDGSTLANTMRGITSKISLSGNAAKIARAFESNFVDTSTTGDTLNGLIQSGGASGALAAAQTRVIAGINSAMASTAATASSDAILNMYGGYFTPSSTLATNGTDNIYGLLTATTATHAADAGTVKQYGLYVDNGTSSTNGTSTKYGIFINTQSGADNNYALVTASGAGNVGIGTTSPGRFFDIAGTASVANPKAGYLSVDNILLSGLDGGAYFGSVGVRENQWGLANVGNTWTAKDSNRDWMDVAMSSDGRIQTAVEQLGVIYTSSNYGGTWTAQSVSSLSWQSVAMSSDGRVQTATANGGNIYTSSDYGVTWSSRDSSRSWRDVDMSSDGKYQTAVVAGGGNIYISSDYGATWTAKISGSSFNGIAVSSDGKYQTAADLGGTLYTSSDYGANWTARDSARSWRDVDMSSDGKYQTAVVWNSPANIYTSSDYGVTWTARTSGNFWMRVAVSNDGKYQTAVGDNNGSGAQIYVSSNYGVSWSAKNSARLWSGIAMSSDGKIQTASVRASGQLYVSYADSTILGNVGIGTTSPNNALEVRSTTSPQLRVAYDTSAYFTTAVAATTGAVTFDTNGTTPSFTFSDPVSFSSTVGSSLNPTIDNTYSLGTAALRWHDIQVGPGSVNLSSTTGTSGAGTDYTLGKLAFTTTNLQLTTSAQGAGSAGTIQIATGANIGLNMNTSGNVGIGTTDPGTTLQVGTGANGVSSDGTIRVGTGNGGGSYMTWDLGVSVANSYSFFIKNRDRAAPDFDVDYGTGNVGIGLTAPNSKLHVNGSAAIGYSSAITAPSNGLAVSGSVGVGTTAPRVSMEIQDPNTAAATIGTDELFELIRQSNGGNAYAQAASFALGSYAINNGGNGFGPSTRLDIKLKNTQSDIDSTNVTVMTLQDNGNVGIGTTGPGYNLDIQAFQASLEIKSTGGESNQADLRLYGGAANAQWNIGTNGAAATAGAADNLYFQKAAGTSGIKMVIQDNGNVGIGTTTPTNLLTLGTDLGSVAWSANSKAVTLLNSAGTAGSNSGYVLGQSTTDYGYMRWTYNSITANAYMVLQNVNNQALSLQGFGGNVGIGTTNPGGTLSIVSTGTTGTTTSSAFNLTANSVNTGTVGYIQATGLTTGKLFDINATYAPSTGPTNFVYNTTVTNAPTSSADTVYSFYHTLNDNTSLANVVNGVNSAIGLQGNAAKQARAISTYFTDTSTTGDTLIGIIQTGGASGALSATQTRNIHGIFSNMTSTAATANADDILNMYGGYFAPSSTLATAGTDNIYGLFTSTTATHAADAGTVKQYGLYVDNGTSSTNGTSTKYGIFINTQSGADNNYALVTASGAGNVGIGTTSPTYNLDIAAATGNATFGIRNTTAGSQSTFNLWDAGTQEWQFGKNTDNSFFIYDSVNTRNVFQVLGTNLSLQPVAGNVGIGTTAPSTALSVIGNNTDDTKANAIVTITNNATSNVHYSSTLRLNVGTAASTNTGYWVQFWSDVTSGDTGGTRRGDIRFSTSNAVAYDTSALDFAERFTLTETTEFGDIVGTTSTGNHKANPGDSLVGVVSNTAGFVGGQYYGNGNYNEALNPIVGLLGQIATKVNSSNGPIHIGDSIAVSSTPGVGMKATAPGMVIGQALEDYDNSDPTAVGQIKVYVSRTWYLGTNLADNGSVATSGSNQPTDPSIQLASNITNADGTLTAKYQGQILTSDQIQKLVREEVARQVAALGFTNGQVAGTSSAQASGSAQATSSAEATSSGTLADQANQTLADLNKLLATTNLKLDTLTVTGNSMLASTQVAGTFSQDGTLIIDLGKQINVLGNTLYLQNDTLAGDATTQTLVDIGAGKITIDKDGNIKLAGDISANSLTLAGNKTAGSGKVLAGQGTVVIQTPAVNTNSKIIVTFTSDYAPATRYAVIDKEVGSGFRVSLDAPVSADSTFDWIIIGAKEVASQ